MGTDDDDDDLAVGTDRQYKRESNEHKFRQSMCNKWEQESNL
jgi:hypothetical protein